MSDIVNAYFRKFYPADFDTAWVMEWCVASTCRRYKGEAGRDATIFPSIECADGFSMSVQGHFGAYSFPRDDFADYYSSVEILCPREELFEKAVGGNDVGDERLYGYVPVEVVFEAIEKHGGMKVQS